MDAFEQMYLSRIVIQLTLRDMDGKRGPWLVAKLYQSHQVDTAQQPLVSAKLRCSASDFTSMDVALFRVLYALDSALADKELEDRVK